MTEFVKQIVDDLKDGFAEATALAVERSGRKSATAKREVARQHVLERISWIAAQGEFHDEYALECIRAYLIVLQRDYP